MGLFDEIGKKASKTYHNATEKTSKFSKVAKLKMKMGEDKDQVDELYQDIGKKVYEKHIREEDIDISSYLEERCSDIDLLCDEIEGIRQEILSLQDKRQCPNCYEEIEKEYNYCPNCGQKQQEEIEKDKVNSETEKENLKQEE